MKKLFLIAALTLGTATAASANPAPLNLSCFSKDGQVDVQLFSGNDRIRLPSSFLPPNLVIGLANGGSQGWFRVKNVTADERTIRAKAYISFVSSPAIYIDRVAGTISVSSHSLYGGSGQYTGVCEPAHGDEAPKF